MIIWLIGIFGLCLGSFINALVWRLHQQEATNSKNTTPKGVKSASKKEYSILYGRSMCPNCHHRLGRYDLVPLVSWLWLKGRCRYCHESISWQYPLVEGVTAGLFLFSYLFWPEALHGLGIAELLFWLIFLVGFIALAVYDLSWFILPNRIIYPLLAIGVIQLLLIAILKQDTTGYLLGGLWGVLIAGGMFYLLFEISKGQWIGGGDVKLGALLGLIVGGPLMSILLLFIASLLGSVVAIPLLATGRNTRTTKLPFGPFLIIAAIIVRLFGASVITWYKRRYTAF